ncbi:NAD(P)H-binding protein [Robbsia sp. Bb-Pol-6]|uniref:NAD(P)H-binding protein n=1 Tax=Robbsia betulipollinis TaxID=2981849 RepID=A0ABT3ZGN7_9BURK|nr:NAD(P)H-binding protein [Robbsia betulipollinis]MCY0385688.1 NAD(P)H-binding protein [Robbsia betulipollinis]
MKIGITGASGRLGGEVWARLRVSAANHALIGLGRKPAASSPATNWRRMDYDRPETLGAAFAGLDRLLLVPTPDLQPGALGRQLCAAIDAAADAGVGHVYLLSALHAAGTAHASDLTRGYTLAEQRLSERCAHATVFRTSFYVETFAAMAKMSIPHGTMFGLAENKVSFISRGDVARSLAGALHADSLPRRHYDLTGPVSVSGAERAGLVAELSGRPMAFAVMSKPQLRDALSRASLPDFIVESLVAMQETFAQGAFDLVTEDVLALTGHAPKPMKAALAEAMQ